MIAARCAEKRGLRDGNPCRGRDDTKDIAASDLETSARKGWFHGVFPLCVVVCGPPPGVVRLGSPSDYGELLSERKCPGQSGSGRDLELSAPAPRGR